MPQTRMVGFFCGRDGIGIKGRKKMKRQNGWLDISLDDFLMGLDRVGGS